MKNVFITIPAFREHRNIVLLCEKILNLANRKSSMLMIYNEGMLRVRVSDGQHIYPMICFRCKTITEFADDQPTFQQA